MATAWQDRLASAYAHRRAVAAAESGKPNIICSVDGQWYAHISMRSSDVQHAQLFADEAGTVSLTWAVGLALLEQPDFADFFSGLFRESKFPAFFFECPPISATHV